MLNADIIRAYNDLLELREHVSEHRHDLTAHFVAFCATNMAHSPAQFLQDLFAAFLLRGKRNGFFVEFGALDGIVHSNTYLLEHRLDWKGILAEPATCWHAQLKNNRKAAIDTRYVWSETGATIEFVEAEIMREMSTAASLAAPDLKGINYSVETISLDDLLRLHDCPRQIDYMSVDTEGSELAILRSFDFSPYEIGLITVEHNYHNADRAQLYDLLTGQGFVRVFEDLSRVDDWYAHRRILEEIRKTPPGVNRRA